jgi:hypothetical protein
VPINLKMARYKPNAIKRGMDKKIENAVTTNWSDLNMPHSFDKSPNVNQDVKKIFKRSMVITIARFIKRGKEIILNFT